MNRHIYVDFRKLEEADNEHTSTLHYGGVVYIYEKGKRAIRTWGVGTDRNGLLFDNIRDTLNHTFNLNFDDYEKLAEGNEKLEDPFFLDRAGEYVEIIADANSVIDIKSVEIEHYCQCPTCGNKHQSRHTSYPHETWGEK